MKKIKYKSIMVMVILWILLGIQLICFPEILLFSFDINPITDNWLRLLGMLFFAVAISHIGNSLYGTHFIIKHFIISAFMFKVALIFMILMDLLPSLVYYYPIVFLPLTIWALFENSNAK